LETFFQQVINGLVLGSMYALVALGYTMVYGIISLINFAHGEILMVGALTSWTVVQALADTGWPGWVLLLISFVAAIIACSALNFAVEKIAYSAFHASRLEWVLRKCGVEQLYFTGIVTNGGVASTVRDAHVREFECTVIEDGCAAFSDDVHHAAIEGLRPVAKILTIADMLQSLAAK